MLLDEARLRVVALANQSHRKVIMLIRAAIQFLRRSFCTVVSIRVWVIRIQRLFAGRGRPRERSRTRNLVLAVALGEAATLRAWRIVPRKAIGPAAHAVPVSRKLVALWLWRLAFPSCVSEVL